MHYIYVIRNNINGKLYVGQANNPKKRWARHKSDAKIVPNKMVISRAIHKYGHQNFTFTVIEEWLTLEEINEAEIFWIEFFETRKFFIGYNIEPGGNNGPVSLITRVKLSAAQKGKPAWNKGMKFGPSWNKNLFSIAWPEDQELLDMVNANGLTFVAKKIGCSLSAVSKKLRENDLKHIRSLGNHDTQFTQGSGHKMSKLTEQDVLDIVELSKQDIMQLQIAEQFRISRQTVNAILCGRRWNHLTHIRTRRTTIGDRSSS